MLEKREGAADSSTIQLINAKKNSEIFENLWSRQLKMWWEVSDYEIGRFFLWNIFEKINIFSLCTPRVVIRRPITGLNYVVEFWYNFYIQPDYFLRVRSSKILFKKRLYKKNWLHRRKAVKKTLKGLNWFWFRTSVLLIIVKKCL